MITLLYLLGTSDLVVQGQSLGAPQPVPALGETTARSFRERCEALLATDPSAWPEIELIRLAPQLAYVEQSWGTVDRLLLVATDQADQPFRATDTAPAADLIKRLFARSRPQLKVKVLKPPGDRQPVELDQMLEWIDRTLAHDPGINDGHWILARTGGIPAMGDAALLALVTRARDRTRAVYLPRDGTPMEDFAPRQVLAILERNRLRTLVDARDFGGTARLAPDTPAGHLAAALDARQRLDFPDAARHAQRAAADLKGTERQAARDLENHAHRMAARDPAAFAIELGENALQPLRRGHWVEFLGAVFRMSEFVLQWLAHRTDPRLPEPGTSRWDRKAQPVLEDLERSEPEFKRRLEDGQLQARPTEPVLLALASLLGPPDVQPLVAAIERLEPLRDLRSDVLHNAQPITGDNVRTALDAADDDAVIAAVQAAAGGSSPQPFDRTLDLMLRLLDR